MTTFRFELLDTETDAVVDHFEIQTWSEDDAYVMAEEEAEYQGLALGDVKRV